MSSLTELLGRANRWAKLALAFAALLYGLTWIPLRALAEVGIQGAWATLVFYALACALALPFMIARWRKLIAARPMLWLTALMAALSFTLYATAFQMTDVVKVILLYYLTPIWSTLLARVLMKEPITAIRIAAIVMGLSGIAVLFEVEHRLPLPENPGDWIALIAGIIWAGVPVSIAMDRQHEAEEFTFAACLLTIPIAIALTFLPASGSGPMPDFSIVLGTLHWLLPTVLAIVLLANFLIMWACRYVDPGLTGLLFLTEISIATGTAAILTDEPFGWREIIGVILISAAGLAEVIFPPKKRRPG